MTAPAPTAPDVGFDFFALRGYSRADTVITTASLAAGASATGTVDLAPGWRLYKAALNRPARVRLYASTAQRTADAARVIGTDPDTTTDHGLFFEFVSDSTLLSAVLSPQVDAYCPSGISVPWHVTNQDVSTGVVTVTLTWVRTE